MSENTPVPKESCPKESQSEPRQFKQTALGDVSVFGDLRIGNIHQEIHVYGSPELKSTASYPNSLNAATQFKPDEISPDAEKDCQPEPQPAFFIDSPYHPLHASFFDLNLFLGLERKGFISVLAGYRGDKVLENLRAVETLLWCAMREGEPHYLPTRWWTKLIFNKSLRPPTKESEVWAQIVGDDDISKCLRNDGLPDFVVPGIILEVEENEHRDGITGELIESIINWCQCLIKDIFGGSVATIVNFHFHSTAFTSIEKTMSNLSQELKYLTKELNGSKRILNISLRKTCENVYGFSNCRSEAWSSEQEKEAIENWIRLISKKLNKTPERILRNYPELKALCCGSSRHPKVGTESMKAATEQREELNENSHISNQLVYLQLLKLTEEFLPEEVFSLVKTYTNSDCLAMDCQSLVFAKMFDSSVVSDMLIDVWIQDSAWIQDSNPNQCVEKIKDGLSLALFSGTDSFIDDLVLAILRRLSRASSEKEDLAEIINSIRHLLSRELREIAEFHLNMRDVENQEFLTRLASDQSFLSLAMRSGISLTQILDSCTCKDNTFTSIRFVCEINATQYLQDTFTEILRLDEISRAYLGLCTTEGFDNIHYEIREKIINWRNYQLD